MKKDTPLVSVVIPTFNYGRYLREAVESVLGQTYERIELIVVDDGSTDDTAAVAGNFGNRLRYLYQENSGIGLARNAGVRVATGELLAFLDSDDIWVADKLMWQVDVLRQKPDVDIVYGHARQYFSDDVSEEFKMRKGYKQEVLPARLSTAMLVRRRSFDRVGPFQDLHVGVDQEWYMRAMDGGLKFVMLSEVVFHRRIHENNSGVRATEEDKRQRLHVIKEALERRRSKSGPPSSS